MAIFGETVTQSVMRAIYFNYAIDLIRTIESTGATAQEISEQEQQRQRDIWNADPTFSNCPEMEILKRKAQLPNHWDLVELSEFSDNNVDDLQLLAARDIPPRTKIASPSGKVLHEANKFTIRLSNYRHLLMCDGDGTNNSIFQRINHSFNPNVKCTPIDSEDRVSSETLKLIRKAKRSRLITRVPKQSSLRNRLSTLNQVAKLVFEYLRRGINYIQRYLTYFLYKRKGQ